MVNPQEIFDKIKKAKKEQRDIREIYRDSLNNNHQYQRLIEDLDEGKERKKEIEDSVKKEMGSNYERLEKLKHEVKDNQEMLAGITLNYFIDGKAVEIKDEYNNLYEPIFSVRYQKTGVISKT